METFGEETPKDFKMDPELKAKWVEALRSGAHRQARWQLAHDGEFNGLVVLNEIGGFGGHAGAGSLPDLYQCSSLPIPGSVQLDLSFKSDVLEWSFEQIADWIEENL